MTKFLTSAFVAIALTLLCVESVATIIAGVAILAAVSFRLSKSEEKKGGQQC